MLPFRVPWSRGHLMRWQREVNRLLVARFLGYPVNPPPRPPAPSHRAGRPAACSLARLLVGSQHAPRTPRCKDPATKAKECDDDGRVGA